MLSTMRAVALLLFVGVAVAHVMHARIDNAWQVQQMRCKTGHFFKEEESIGCRYKVTANPRAMNSTHLVVGQGVLLDGNLKFGRAMIFLHNDNSVPSSGLMIDLSNPRAGPNGVARAGQRGSEAKNTVDMVFKYVDWNNMPRYKDLMLYVKDIVAAAQKPGPHIMTAKITGADKIRDTKDKYFVYGIVKTGTVKTGEKVLVLPGDEDQGRLPALGTIYNLWDINRIQVEQLRPIKMTSLMSKASFAIEGLHKDSVPRAGDTMIYPKDAGKLIPGLDRYPAYVIGKALRESHAEVSARQHGNVLHMYPKIAVLGTCLAVALCLGFFSVRVYTKRRNVEALGHESDIELLSTQES